MIPEERKAKKEARKLSKTIEKAIKSVKQIRSHLRDVVKRTPDIVASEVLDLIDRVELRFYDLLVTLDELKRALDELG